MTYFAVTVGSGKLCHLEVERLGEFRRYAILVEDHLHGVAEAGQGLLARVAVGVRAAGRPEPCMRAPDTVLVLLDGDRDMHCSHCCLLPIWFYATADGRRRLVTARRGNRTPSGSQAVVAPAYPLSEPRPSLPLLVVPPCP
jgi:hypothetical protein